MSITSVHRGYRKPISAPAPIDDAAPDTTTRSSRPVRRESRLTFGGLVYIGVTLFMAIGAVNSQNNLLFWLFGVAIATLIVSGIFSGNALMKTRLRSRAFNEIHAGQRLRLHYTVTNRSKFFPLFAALITEETENGKELGGLQPASVIHIGPGHSNSFTANLTPLHRGRMTLRAIRLSTRFPFGLLQKSLIFQQPRTLLVLPHHLQIRPGLLTPSPTMGDHARRRSARSGRSDEFWGLREYVPGDPRRRIAWKHSARRGELVVVEHAQTVSTRLWLWLIEPDTDHPQHLLLTERVIALGASLIKHGSMRTLPIGLWYPQRDIRFDPKTGRAHAGRVLRTLATVDLSQQRVAPSPPPMSPRDRIFVIQAGMKPPHGASDARVIDVTKPSEWLLDPQSLPQALGEGV